MKRRFLLLDLQLSGRESRLLWPVVTLVHLLEVPPLTRLILTRFRLTRLIVRVPSRITWTCVRRLLLFVLGVKFYLDRNCNRYEFGDELLLFVLGVKFYLDRNCNRFEFGEDLLSVHANELIFGRLIQVKVLWLGKTDAKAWVGL